VQVRPNLDFGYRPSMGEYEVMRDIGVPSGIARANPNYGTGGGNQFHIQDYANVLRLVREHPLRP
jgi:hypothetical protein